MDVMEQVEDPELEKKIQIPALILQELLPPDTSRYFRYNGSLTTPGCFESVVWTVFRETQKLSHKQVWSTLISTYSSYSHYDVCVCVFQTPQRSNRYTCDMK